MGLGGRQERMLWRRGGQMSKEFAGSDSVKSSEERGYGWTGMGV